MREENYFLFESFFVHHNAQFWTGFDMKIIDIWNSYLDVDVSIAIELSNYEYYLPEYKNQIFDPLFGMQQISMKHFEKLIFFMPATWYYQTGKTRD